MKKILLIEDNDDIRNNTAEILELSHYKVTVAENGKIGVEKALAEHPDLIICDIMMPVLDGYGVLHTIHNNEDLVNTPFIFLTAKTERSDFRKGMELGADDYITKPFTGTELLSAVESRFRKMELLKQQFASGIEGFHGLKQVAFHHMADHPLEMLTQDRNVNRYKKKQTVYSEGNHPNRLYYVLKGKLKAFKTNDDGKELITELYCPGDFLGHVALLERSAYKDTAQALEETELVEIPREDFDELVSSNNEVSRKFINLLAKNVSEKETQLLGLAYNSLRKKVADALLMLQQKYNQSDEAEFAININRENLASIAGTAKESLIRTLSDFRNERLIDIKPDGSLIILNRKKLEYLVN